MANTKSKSKNNHSILSHPIDTIKYWYDEVQILPTTFKRKAKLEVNRGLLTIRRLKNELKTANKMSRKKWSSNRSTQKGKTAIINKIKAINVRLSSAKNQLKMAKTKQKYLNALEKAISSFNNLFRKKHVSTVRSVQTKKRHNVATHPTHQLTHRRLAARRTMRQRKPHAVQKQRAKVGTRARKQAKSPRMGRKSLKSSMKTRRRI